MFLSNGIGLLLQYSQMHCYGVCWPSHADNIFLSNGICRPSSESKTFVKRHHLDIESKPMTTFYEGEWGDKGRAKKFVTRFLGPNEPFQY